MRFNLLGGALALAGTAVAFSDSTPFVLLSTSTFDNAPDSNKIQTSSSVLKFARDVLAKCPTERYLLVSQPGVNAADLRRSDGCAMPHLCKAVEDSRVHGKYSVAEVVGDVNGKGLAEYIGTACEQKGKAVVIQELNLASVSSDGKANGLAENDDTLGRELDTVTASESYTILFVSTPAEPVYEAEFDEPLRMDLKRHVQQSVVRRAGNETEWAKLPLFEKYQFFTPGIFMAIITAVVLFSILYGGLAGLASLQVSYGAFEKEMGPAAQKKQQ
ncbi:hypothetical protein HJFPF1_06783 [Paramyrothecium foliicola]|nr:hypothetical protein HJFPF1_06783 [Paramyrothecium foliicola]